MGDVAGSAQVFNADEKTEKGGSQDRGRGKESPASNEEKEAGLG